MNKFKAFAIDDTEGMNAHFSKYPVGAKGASFISNGKILFQYDDGERAPAAVRIVELKEQILSFERAKDEIEFSRLDQRPGPVTVHYEQVSAWYPS